MMILENIKKRLIFTYEFLINFIKIFMSILFYNFLEMRFVCFFHFI